MFMDVILDLTSDCPILVSFQWMGDLTQGDSSCLYSHRVIFFGSGFTKASLSLFGEAPVWSNLLTSSVGRVKITGSIALNKSVGIGSDSQLLDSEERMTLATPWGVRSWKESSIYVALTNSVGKGPMLAMVVSSWFLILAIFVIKKLLKLSASSWLVKPGGSGRSFPLPRNESHILKICFGLFQFLWSLVCRKCLSAQVSMLETLGLWR